LAQLHEQCYSYRCIQKGYNETEIHGYTTVSFMERKGLPNLWVAYHPFVCCPGNEAANPQKSGILLLARESSKMCIVLRIHVWTGVMFELILTTQPEWTTGMQADLDILVPNRGLSQKLTLV
jgi:hypothetical protein